MSLRDPYPVIKFENDNDFTNLQQIKTDVPLDDAHLAQRQNPWLRLSSTDTLATARRSVAYYDESAPADDLDFVLKGVYDNHCSFGFPRGLTVLQRETTGDDHGRLLKNRIKVVLPQKPPMNHPIKIEQIDRKENFFSVKKGIECPHVQSTNGGYKRKVDGGFYEY